MAVGLDHQYAAYCAVKQIIATGKRHVAYLGARLDNRTQLRLAGYNQAIGEAGLQPLPILTEQHSSFTLEKHLFLQALARVPTLDGIFCTNDDIAIGAMLACHKQGLVIPEQMSIVRYNGLDIGQAITPKLTSIATPRREIGQKSAELLFTALQGNPIKHKVYDFGFSFIQGESL